MDIASYFDRIGYRGSEKPTRSTLDALIAHHQQAVPFENLDIVRLGRPIVLNSGSHYRKIVEERRGGFCYELNGLLAWLLESLGYGVTLGYGIWPGGDGAWTVPFDHMVLAVTVPGSGERLLADVGFGADSPTSAVPLVAGESAFDEWKSAAFRASLINMNLDCWQIEALRAEGNWALIYEANLTPRRIDDFAGRCSYFQSSPESHFTQNVICSRPLVDGRVTIGGGRFILTSGGERSERPLSGLADELDLLRKWFSIDLAPDIYGEVRR